jgi:pSer/pThr/pTyr-binding forkhead associated (FHA) protein
MLIRFAYLAILWIFVLSAVSVVRSDMFGARIESITEGANSGETISLDLAPLLIGRGSDAAIRLDDDYVSTRHARIASSGDQWFVEDLGSTNGTYIGSSRLTQPTTVQLGTQIRIGKTTLELRK